MGTAPREGSGPRVLGATGAAPGDFKSSTEA